MPGERGRERRGREREKESERAKGCVNKCGHKRGTTPKGRVVSDCRLRLNWSHTSHPSNIDHPVLWQTVVSIIDDKVVFCLQVECGEVQSRVVVGARVYVLHCDNAQSLWQCHRQGDVSMDRLVARRVCTKIEEEKQTLRWLIFKYTVLDFVNVCSNHALFKLQWTRL